MTKEELQERIRTLEIERVRVASAYEGAIQDCNFWLQKLETPTITETKETE